jgi:hypothetical protein
MVTDCETKLKTSYELLGGGFVKETICTGAGGMLSGMRMATLFWREQERWIMLWRRGKAELTACIHGVKAAMQCGMGRIIIETDAVLVQQYKDSNLQAIFYWGLST